jgi:hypothetical protein
MVMKKFRILVSLALLMGSAAAHAAISQYQFTGFLYVETTADFTPVPPADYLFSSAATISGTLNYNTDATTILSNVTPTGDLSVFGPYSLYAGTIGNLTGVAGGHAFSADSGSSIVANSNPGDTTYDGVLNLAGTFDGNVVGAGFSGFSMGDFNLVSFNLWSTSSSGILSSQSLPGTLANGNIATGIYLIFENSVHEQRIVGFITDITPVPLPSTIWFMGSALVGLASIRNKKAA